MAASRDRSGKNVTTGKANKTTLPDATKSRRANAKELNFNNRMKKHPLVRNAQEQSSEKKYREGKVVPVKPKNKTPKTVAPAAFGKKPNKPRGGLRGGGMGGSGLRGPVIK